MKNQETVNHDNLCLCQDWDQASRQLGMSADVTSGEKMRKHEVHFPVMRENSSDICV